MVIWDYHVILLLHSEEGREGCSGSQDGAAEGKQDGCRSRHVVEEGEGGGIRAGAGRQGEAHIGQAGCSSQAAVVGELDTEEPENSSRLEAIQAATYHRAPVLVLDLDSTLPFPCPLDVYAEKALRSSGSDQQQLQPEYARCALRVVCVWGGGGEGQNLHLQNHTLRSGRWVG